jgi:DNA-binding HxlR family transcriptional regulator
MKKKSGQASKIVSTIFIGKWTAKIMSSLREKPHRHGQLRRRRGNVSQRTLTRTLRNLESSGLIAKSKSIAVEYSLTKLDRTFVAPLTGICRRANQHHKELSSIVHLLETNAKQT